MSVFAVEYVYAANTEATRDEHRPAHRAFLADLKPENGSITLVASGPYADGSGALLLISAPDEATLGEALKNDPFNVHKTLAALRITEWVPVTGELSHHA
ncbi:YciI family protein [Paeniglutamicibacter sp. R2-26]|uniref:YciI family protein n=1 Tax=Paeniglutamicibacter sp. R2-26 TaxID=3144417 RepID=UPI003EE6F981